MKTTINLRAVDLPKLHDICEKSGLTRSQIIGRCLEKLYGSNKRLRMSLIKRLVEYQPRGGGYVISHVSFSYRRYNLNINFRVFCRCSVSLMVTIAICLFLKEVEKDLGYNDQRDNYFHFSHDYQNNISFSEEKWVISWEKLIKKE